MIFRNLTMAGFKSFAEKANMDIEDGLTGIVGPNGCGKSNIVEAVRWIMIHLTASTIFLSLIHI